MYTQSFKRVLALYYVSGGGGIGADPAAAGATKAEMTG